jgi:hypothetical protein
VCAESYRSRTAVDDPPTASRVARARRRVVGRALLAPLVLAAFFSVPAGSASAVITFDTTWGSVGTGNGNFTLPTRVATDPTSLTPNSYVSDTGNHRIQEFNSSNTFVRKWGATLPPLNVLPIAGTGNGEFNSPQGIATDSSSNVFVADTNNNRIQKFSSTGTYLAQWGSAGTNNGQFSLPQGIARDSSNNIYVADTGNNRIQEFDSSNTFIRKWGSAGTGDGQFASPSGVAVDSSGNVYVADSGNNRIQKFSSTGTYLTQWGSAGTGNGQFGVTTTLDVATGSHDNVIVADTANNRIQKFRPSGTFITTWGTLGAGTPNNFNGPSGVAVDSTDHVYVVDRANNRIQKYHESDIVEPDTTIDSPPYGLTNDATPTFTFSSPSIEPLLTPGFECRLDSADWASCASPKTYSTLSDGSHTFHVRAVDAAGNPDPTPASESFTVDATPPDTTLDSGPSDPTNDATPTFTFSSEPGASFQCRFDLGSFGACSGPGNAHTPSALGEGSHTFYVRAVDAAGNPDPNPASQTFTVDITDPETTLDSGPSDPTNDPTPTFSFDSSEAGSSFQCKVDSASYAPCSSPKTTSTLGSGSHTFYVFATDQAGNDDPTPASQSFTVDTMAPDTTITDGPMGKTLDTTPTFSFSSEPGASFQCRIDSGSFGACSGPGDAHTSGALADGSHTFYVRAVDAAGNEDQSPASRSFTVVTFPETIIDSGPSGTTNDPTPTFTFHSSEAGSSFRCKVNSSSYTSCSSPNTTFHLSDGSGTFYVRAVDQAGNIDPTPASRSFTVRTAAVHVSGSTLVVTAAVGAHDNFTIAPRSASVLRVTDSPFGAYTGSGVHAWAGCTRIGDYTADCNAAPITLIQVASWGGSDHAVNLTTIRSSLDGGAGGDVLVGGSSDDTLIGGAGADVMKGMNGNDQLFARDGATDADTTINCDGGSTPGTADKAVLDPLSVDPDSVVTNCETKTRP